MKNLKLLSGPATEHLELAGAGVGVDCACGTVWAASKSAVSEQLLGMAKHEHGVVLIWRHLIDDKLDWLLGELMSPLVDLSMRSERASKR